MSEEAKEIAKNLIWEYLPILDGWMDNEKTELAKKCALITVNNLISEVDFLNGCWSDSLLGMQHSSGYRINKWKEVKTEIENYGR